MNIGKRAGLFLVRNKNKAWVLFLVLTVIAVLVQVGLAVGNSIHRSEKKLRETMGGYFTVKRNNEQGYTQPVDDTLVEKIVKLDGIKVWNGSDIAYMYTENAELIPGRFTTGGDSRAEFTRFLGNKKSEKNEYFVLQTFTLTKGRHIQPGDENKAVISEALAKNNHFAIGDALLVFPNMEDIPQEKKEQISGGSLEIVGIFSTERKDDSENVDTAECDIEENFIFTDTCFIRNMQGQITGRKIHEYSLGAAFFVEDAGELDEIVEKVKEIPGYDWAGYRITKNNKKYNDLEKPLLRMSSLLTSIVIGVVAISVIVLALVFVMWMKDRMHETGIYLSLGIRKREIIGQYILENSIVALAAFLTALVISLLAANKIGELVAGTGADVGIAEFLGTLAVGYLIVISSTVISSVRVMRMQPKDILAEDN